MAKHTPHIGSNLDDFLKDEGMFEGVHAKARKRALSEQMNEGMQAANTPAKTVGKMVAIKITNVKTAALV